ncbi:sensor histidine kinase [Eionea flava]
MAFRSFLTKHIHPANAEGLHADDSHANGFFPYLCSGTAVFGLVLLGELIALALVLMASSLSAFSWGQLGYVSMVVQWIVLLSAAALCYLSPRLAQLSPQIAGAIAYGCVLLIAYAVIASGLWLMMGVVPWLIAAQYMMLAAIIAGIFLRYLYLQQQLRRQQQAELQSRIQALHARIRPHFLFNALNAAASLIPTKPVLAEQVIEDLSEVFRTSLQQASLVPLQDELDLCQRYVAIEQVRLGDRLTVEWHLQENMPASHVPSFLLQPLIENAICHGIQRIADGGKIEISVTANDHFLQLRVCNPVTDLPASETDALTYSLNKKAGNHMALENISYRLQAHYGDQAVVNAGLIGDTETRRYKVDIALPLTTAH